MLRCARSHAHEADATRAHALTRARVRADGRVAYLRAAPGRLPCVLTEACDASLADRIAARDLAQGDAGRYALHVSTGLAFVHERKVVHGALRPDGVFLFGASAKIGSFGPLTGDRTYAPPELESAPGDVYS